MLGENTIKKLNSVGSKRVFVQIPEGLKTRAKRISDFLEDVGFMPFISIEPCFGACDLRDTDAERLGCDTILHVGHSDFGVESRLPVVYEEWRVEFDPVTLLEKNLDKFSVYETVGLASSIQYIGSLEKAKRFLESRGKKTVTGKAGNLREGQVLGCDFTAAATVDGDVDCFLFIGSGDFHASGLASHVKKPVFFLDAETETFERVYPDKKSEIKSALRIEKARGLKKFAVYVSTKPGQMKADIAVKIKNDLESKGKEAFLISADMLTPEKITGMGIEVIVNTACPRIYDDREMFGVVILNPEDASRL